MEQEKMYAIGAGSIVLLIIIWWFFFRKPATPASGAAADSAKTTTSSGNKPTIYGSMGCPYTVKQIEKYKDHEFVDCSSGGCPSFVTAYPTTKWPDGKIEVGFS